MSKPSFMLIHPCHCIAGHSTVITFNTAMIHDIAQTSLPTIGSGWRSLKASRYHGAVIERSTTCSNADACNRLKLSSHAEERHRFCLNLCSHAMTIISLYPLGLAAATRLRSPHPSQLPLTHAGAAYITVPARLHIFERSLQEHLLNVQP